MTTLSLRKRLAFVALAISLIAALGFVACSTTDAPSGRRMGAYQPPPASTGFVHVTGGHQDPNARAIDLGSGDVDGSLPLAMLAACDAGQIVRYDGGWGCADESAGGDTFTAAGDLSGDSTSQTVEKIHGTTVPAGGALATGSVLRATGASAAGWGAVDLADTDAVTGTLPLANVGAPTGTGFAMVSGGVWQSSAFTDPLSIGNGGTGTSSIASGVVHSTGSSLTSSQIVNADVSAAAGITCSKTTCSNISSSGASGTVQTSDGSGGLTGATNVLAGSGFLSIGSSPASTGSIRSPNGFAIWSRTTTPADVPLMLFDTANELYVGTDSGFGGVAPQATSIKLYASTAVQAGIGGSTYLYVNGGAVEAWKPITGSSGGSSPYGVHGETGAVAAPNGGTTTLSASEYKNQLIQVCSQVGAGTTGNGAGNLDLPTPAAGAGYWKWVYNGCQTGTPTLRRAGGGGNTTTGPGLGKVAGFWVTSGGAWRMTPDSTL